MWGKLFNFVSPAFLGGFVLTVALLVALEVSAPGSSTRNQVRLAYLIILTGIWGGTIFWFGERFLKALLKKEFVFAIGSAAIVAIVIALNARSYFAEKAAYISAGEGISFGFSHDGFEWGFPLKLFFEGGCFPCDPFGTFTVNWFLAIGGAWLVGTLLQKFVHARRLK